MYGHLLFMNFESRNPVTILLSRTDNIGDVVLTLPLAGMLKEHFPQCRIVFLAAAYTLPVVCCSEHIDDVWNWDELRQLPEHEQIQRLQAERIEWCFHVFPRPEIAQLVHRAGVPNRVGTRNRLYHWRTCNHRVALSRKNSVMHEAQLNAWLLKPLVGECVSALEEIQRFYGLTGVPILPQNIRAVLHPTKFNLIIHPKSQGSAPEWQIAHYKRLLELLPSERFSVIITGTAKEGAQIQEFINEAVVLGVQNLTGATTLRELIALVAASDALVAASTGPLHVAAALGIYALGLFAPIRPMHAGRWKPLGAKARTLSLEHECHKCTHQAVCECISAVTPESVAAVLVEWETMRRTETEE